MYEDSENNDILWGEGRGAWEGSVGEGRPKWMWPLCDNPFYLQQLICSLFLDGVTP